MVSYLHGSRIGVMVEVNCETDFVARNPDFVTFAKEVAMQVAAMNPQFVSQDEIPAALLDKEKEIRVELAKKSGKPDSVIPKIIEGQLAKWSKEICLLDQVWVKDPEGKKDVRSLLTDLVAKTGENVKVRRFVRFEVGFRNRPKQDRKVLVRLPRLIQVGDQRHGKRPGRGVPVLPLQIPLDRLVVGSRHRRVLLRPIPHTDTTVLGAPQHLEIGRGRALFALHVSGCGSIDLDGVINRRELVLREFHVEGRADYLRDLAGRGHMDPQFEGGGSKVER